MKKKILLSLLTFFAFGFFALNVNATILNIPSDTEAKAPLDIPSENEMIYAALAEPFDFSSIKFTVDGKDNEYIAGHSSMQKIFLTTKPDFTKTGLAVLGDNWFTAYCLDGNLKYPQYGFLNSGLAKSASDSKNYKEMLDNYVLAALLNNKDIYKVVEEKGDPLYAPTVEYEVVNPKYEANDKTVEQQYIEYLDAGNALEVKVNKIVYLIYQSPSKEITADELGLKKLETSDANFSFKKEDALLDKYTTTKMNSRSYDHALWILEHSYPTLELKQTLEVAGADYDKLVEELKITGEEDAKRKQVGNYVYATIQYAIWKSYDGIDDNGNKLGSTLVGSEELNKLYQYLILDRPEYNGYGSLKFTNTLTLDQPASGKELYKSTDKKFIYGPYKANCDVLSGGNISLSVSSTVKDGIRAVDANGNVINEIEPGKEFYIESEKEARVSNASIKLTLKGATAFEPSTNRGRIYYAHYPFAQNVMSGGKIVNLDLEKSFDLIYNPKTGVENVAVLLLITLVAFSLAYLVLSYKSKSVEL